MYMISAMMYIMGKQVRSACGDPMRLADMKKMTTDFIGYSSINMTWFSYNFILVTMPIFCLALEEHLP